LRAGAVTLWRGGWSRGGQPQRISFALEGVIGEIGTKVIVEPQGKDIRGVIDALRITFVFAETIG